MANFSEGKRYQNYGLEDYFELKPCPSCGASATLCGGGLIGGSTRGVKYEGFAVFCDNPDCGEWTGFGFFIWPEEAVEFWNTRRRNHA